MRKLQIFAKILSAVSDETGIPGDMIASGNRSAETVDARYLLVYFLFRNGFYPSAIAPLIHHTIRSVNRILSTFEDRMRVSVMMQISFARLHEEVGRHCPDITGK